MVTLRNPETLRHLVSALIAGVAVLAASPIWAGTATLAASRDNTMFSDAAEPLSNGAGRFLFTGRTAENTLRRALVAFDIAAVIPPGSVITSVTLSMTMSKTIAGAEDVVLHRIRANWGEGSSDASGPEGKGAAATTGDATWLHRFFDSLPWTTPGGDYAATPSATQSIGGAGDYTWGSTAGMIGDVQTWLDDPASNAGWLLLGNEDTDVTAKRFNSRENGDTTTRPTLAVTFAEAAQAPALSGLALLATLALLVLIAHRRLRPCR